MTQDFKKEFSFAERFNDSKHIMTKYSERIPIICEKSTSSGDLPIMDKRKFLVPNSLKVCQFMFIIRKRMSLGAEEGLFLFINNAMVDSSAIIGELYERQKDKDGFLYVRYSKENVFG